MFSSSFLETGTAAGKSFRIRRPDCQTDQKASASSIQTANCAKKLLPYHLKICPIHKIIPATQEPANQKMRLQNCWDYVGKWDQSEKCGSTAFLMAAKLSLLITCSIRQASSSAVFASTPRLISQPDKKLWRS